MDDYKGTIIEESLKDTSVLKDVSIISTKVEKVTERHNTPWLTKWTLHKVKVPAEQAEAIAEKLSHSIETSHSAWYADFKTADRHYIIFPEKIFFITDRTSKQQYDVPKAYGISLGIPPYQVDFHPEIAEWKR